MKNTTKIILLILLVAFVCALAVSCGGKPDSMELTDGKMPQLTYVLGQDLNLADCTLTVKNGKKTEMIPLDSSDVTVSGYNKDTLGEQTVTISYEGLTTTITVNVVERVVISNPTVDYLVGDAFDKTKGKLTVTEYDGTSRTVMLSSDKVTVSGFDSSSASTDKVISVTFIDGSQSYTGSFKVNVHAIDKVEFRRPNKITYGSHYEGKADLSGGYFTLTGNNGALTRTVALTDDMVSGFNIGAVNQANSPLNQTVTVTFNGVPYTYSIKLTYSDVSLFRDNAAAFAAVDWNTPTLPVISEELGELAMELMQTYVDMSTAAREDIDATIAYSVARAALVYGFNLWAEDVIDYQDAFIIESQQLKLVLASPEAVEDAVERLKNADAPIHTLSPLLVDIITLYGDKVVYENSEETYTFKSFPVMSEEYLTMLSNIFTHILGIHDTLSVIPDEWSADTLTAHSSEVETAILSVLSGYAGYFPTLYDMVSDWRANDDMFDIMYEYLFATDNKGVIPRLYSIGLPTEIEALYQYVSSAVASMSRLESYKLYDATNIFYCYYQALELVEKFEEGTMEYYVYCEADVNKIIGLSSSQIVTFGDMLEDIRTSGFGIYGLSSGLLDNAEFDTFMAKYIELIKHTVETEGYIESAAYSSDIMALFDLFVSLTPPEQYGLITVLSPFYGAMYPLTAFDDSEENTATVSYFALILNDFMRKNLPEAHVESYEGLIFAIEAYFNLYSGRMSKYYTDDELRAEFIEAMDMVTANYTKPENSGAKAAFDLYLGAAYEKYLEIRNKLDVTVGSTNAFAKLDAALVDLQNALYLISSSEIEYTDLTYFLASFERAVSEAKLLEAATTDIKWAYYHEALFEAIPADTAEGTSAVYWTYDFALNYFRDLYVNYLTFFPYVNVYINVYDMYKERNVGAFLDKYYDVISPLMRDNEAPEFDKALVLDVINSFRLLDSESKSFIITLEGDMGLYYGACNKFVELEYSTEVATLVSKLFDLELAYLTYDITKSDVNLENVKSLLNAVTELYAAVNKTEFADFEAFYNYYVEKCEDLTLPATAA